jgi:glyoxylase-like metal-dependent hydrolase (beta-lactamase superfamily II)
MTDDVYEIYAIRYAHREGIRGQHILNADPHDSPMPMDYFVWVIRNASRTILVDTGFDHAEGESRGRTVLRCPAQSLSLLGLDAAQIQDVIITHMHYDHGGNLDKFPAARFHIQDSELQYTTGRAMTHAMLRHPFTLSHVTRLVELVYAERVQFHDGSSVIAPGIDVHKVGGHTRGMQVVTVKTQRGIVVLASDASHYYENMETGAVFPLVENVLDMLEGHRRLYALADSPAHIIPGHDPLVMQRYSAPDDSLDQIVVRLDVAPV